MSSLQDAFRELVRQAPPAGASQVVAIGSLSSTANDDQFVLSLLNGSSVTLPIASVKSYREMLGAFGQRLVEVDLDPSGLPAEAASALGIATSAAAAAGLTPFVLGGGHQADPQTLAAMNALASPETVAKRPTSDFKRPIQDGTYPTPHGLHLDF